VKKVYRNFGQLLYFSKKSQRKQSPKGQKLALSGHPDCQASAVKTSKQQIAYNVCQTKLFPTWK
jgi:hypothetical protein